MIPTPLAGADPCEFAPRWGISLQLARKLRSAADIIERAGLGSLVIISGWRSCAHQEELEQQGRPTAPCDRSTHTICPATGADIWSAHADEPGPRMFMVNVATGVGLRVGGGGPVAGDGLPVDWNHWDLGPRA